MAGDKTYITDDQGKLHRATRVHAVTPTDIVWSSNPNDYTVQVKIGGKWHRAVLTMDAGTSTFFDNINIDKGLIIGSDGKTHTALIVKPESTVTLSSIKTDEHALVSGTTTGETAVVTYEETWGSVKYQDNVNVYKVLVTGSDGKVHTALLTTSAGGGTVQAIVLGPSPLLLPDAVAHSLLYVKAFGGTEQGGVPQEYTRLEYIESSGTQYIDLGYKGNGNTKVEVKFKYHTVTSATGSGRVFGSRNTSQIDAFAIGSASGVVSATTNKVFWCYDGQPYFIDDTEFGLDVWKTVVFSATEHTIDGVSVGDDYAVTTFETPNNLKLFAFDNNGTNGVGYVDIAYCKLWDNGVLVRDLVPVKNSSNVIGMYDRVSGQFLTNAGTGNFVAGPTTVPTPDAPMDIVSNNGVLKYSANMANVNAQTALIGYYISNSGVVTADNNNWIYQDYIPVSPNTTYTLTMSSPVYYVTISEYSTADDSGFVRRNAGTSGDNTTLTITTDATTNFIRFGTNIDRAEVTLERVLAINWQLNKGNSMPYTPYSPTGVYADDIVETIEDTIGNTATAEMLLKVDNYQDAQSIIDGAVTRNVGAKVLDSSLVWTYDSTYGRVNATIPNLWGSTVARTVPGLCTHFKWLSHQETISSITAGQCYSAGANRIFLHISQTSAAAFAAWLDAQRDAGTPVIIVFPLENATTESVTGQTLQVQAGNNTLEITQASLSGLQLEAEYTKVA